MFIVEGCDNAGKTTLVQRLAGDLKLCIIANKHRPKTKSEWFDFQSSAIALSKKLPCIFDRWSPISESVYGPIIRGESIFTDRDLVVAKDAPILARLSPFLIYCRPPMRVVANSFNEREQMAGVADNLLAIMDQFDKVIEHWAHCPTNSYPHVRYDYTEQAAYEKILSLARETMKERFQ